MSSSSSLRNYRSNDRSLKNNNRQNPSSFISLEEYNIKSGTWDAYIRDEKLVGTNGGTFLNDLWQTRDLNTITTESGSGISLSNNQITLQPGTYTVSATAPSYNVESNTIRWYNITDSTTDIIGTNSSAGSVSRIFGGGGGVISILYSKINISSAKVYELQHKCKISVSNFGFGLASGFQTELYSTIQIKRLN